MPTPTKGKRLGGSPSHERQILANLATSLFEHGRITTTETKARRLRPFAERLITKARRGDLHARRQVMRLIRDKGVVHVLFTEIGPRFQNRPGGYTRLTKVGPRPGDNAPMAVIELVEEMAASEGSAPGEAPQAAAAPAASVPAEESDSEAAAEEAEAEEAATEEAAPEGPAGSVPAEESDSEAAAEEAEAEEAATEEAAPEGPAEDARADEEQGKA